MLSIDTADEDANLRPLLTKSAVWSYEDEFRLISTEHPFVFPNVPTTKRGFLPLPKGALRSVIIGAEMPVADREIVRKLVADSGWGIALKIANLVPNRYGFEIAELK